MRRSVLFAMMAVGVGVVGAANVHAQDGAEPIAIDYVAPSGCPSRAAFSAEVSARTSKAREARSGESARTIHVHIERRGEGWSGDLWVDDGAKRTVADGACSVVVGALGLIAALAVDPRASIAPRPAPSEVPEAAPAPVASSASSAPSSAPATASASPEPRPQGGPDRPSASPSIATTPRRTRFGVGAGVEIAAIADAVFAGRVLAEIELAGEVFAPSFGLSLARSLEVERSAERGSANLSWTQAAVDGCPLRFALVETLSVRPCVHVAAGVLDAEGAGVLDARTRSRPWASVGGHGRLVWAILRPVALELDAGAVLPLFRESFYFDPAIGIYEAPVIAGVFRSAIVVRFP